MSQLVEAALFETVKIEMRKAAKAAFPDARRL